VYDRPLQLLICLLLCFMILFIPFTLLSQSSSDPGMLSIWSNHVLRVEGCRWALVWSCNKFKSRGPTNPSNGPSWQVRLHDAAYVPERVPVSNEMGVKVTWQAKLLPQRARTPVIVFPIQYPAGSWDWISKVISWVLPHRLPGECGCGMPWTNSIEHCILIAGPHTLADSLL
jgi:hypothetical protein